MRTEAPAVVMLPGAAFVAGSGVLAAAIAFVGRTSPPPVWLLAVEVMATILGLFVFGSFKYQIHKNALTYGMLLVIAATFWALPTSEWHAEIAAHGLQAWIDRYLLSFHGLDELVHADTMLFILGLTLFVSVIAQTRLLEGVTFWLLRKNRGAIAPTVIAVTAVVALVSGVLDGVSMIGLTIRTLVIILMLAAAPTGAIRQAIMICTTVTTICGVWLAYGEPPNLIMKANLSPWLGNHFFLVFCGPIALITYLIVAWNMKRWLGGARIDLETIDLIDANAEDVRFLQARRHGEVLTPFELVEGHADDLGVRMAPVLGRLRAGDSLGIALVREQVPEAVRRKLLGHFVAEDLAEPLDRHYQLEAAGDHAGATAAADSVAEVLDDMAHRRRRAQLTGAVALLPFVGVLIAHGVNHTVPLFLASFAGFGVALLGIVATPRALGLAMRNARHEYAEYYFLFPLFLSITLLTKAGFFADVQRLIHTGAETFGRGHVALGQFLGSTLLSAILDNNIVADFASRGLHHLDASLIQLFAMAQVAGYALGGCWTHIGSAQSVVAFAFIRGNVDHQFTPVQWIREMTPVILQMLAAIAVLIYLESALIAWLA